MLNSYQTPRDGSTEIQQGSRPDLLEPYPPSQPPVGVSDAGAVATLASEARGTLAPFKYGNFEFTNLNLDNERYSEKAIRIMEIFDGHPALKEFIGDRPCRVNLQLRTTETPADVRDLGKSGVEINLASYFFEKYDVGQIMGMLAHEAALHALSSHNPEVRHEEASLRDMPLPVPGMQDSKTLRLMNTNGAGDPEHIMAAFPSSTRHRIYRETVLTAAELLARDTVAGLKGAKNSDVTNLIDTYLMDVASIAITSDNRKNAIKEPGNTAKVYNAYKEQFLQGMAADSPARPFVPANKGMLDVVRDFARLAVNVGTQNRGDSIQKPAGVAESGIRVTLVSEIEAAPGPALPRSQPAISTVSTVPEISTINDTPSGPRIPDVQRNMENSPHQQASSFPDPPQQIAQAASMRSAGHDGRTYMKHPAIHTPYASPRSPVKAR